MLYGAGFTAIALRTLFPEGVVAAGGFAAAAGLAVMSLTLYRLMRYRPRGARARLLDRTDRTVVLKSSR